MSLYEFTVQVKHKVNSTQILGFILTCLYFTTGHFHTCVLCKKNVAYFPFNSWLSFQRLCRFLWGYYTTGRYNSFHVAAPVIWNSLPEHPHSLSASKGQFRFALKPTLSSVF